MYYTEYEARALQEWKLSVQKGNARVFEARREETNEARTYEPEAVQDHCALTARGGSHLL
jgi:hypothetical protein